MNMIKGFSVCTTVVLLLATFSISQMVSATPLKETKFRCINHMYRNAAFEINDNFYLTIQDSFPKGTEQLQEAVAEHLGLNKDGLKLHEVALLVAKRDITCGSSLDFVMKCNGSSKLANLQVKGIIYPNNSQIELGIPVTVNSFNLTTFITTQGSSSIHEAPVTISIDQMNVDATANVSFGKQKVDIRWIPFFYPYETKGPSYCEKF